MRTLARLWLYCRSPTSLSHPATGGCKELTVSPSTALASAPAGRWGRAAGEGRGPAVAAAAVVAARARLGGAAARLGAGRRRKRGEAGFLAAGCEKCSCVCAAAAEATSGAVQGGAGLRARRGPGCGTPRPSPQTGKQKQGSGGQCGYGAWREGYLGNIRTGSSAHSRAICTDRSARAQGS